MDSNNDEALDIIITNVVATFRTRCHLNLRTIALEGINVIYKPEAGVRRLPNAGMQKTHTHTRTLVRLDCTLLSLLQKVLMKLRKPKITASIWSSGKIICTGATR